MVNDQGAVAWHQRTTLWGVTTDQPRAGAYTPLRFPGQYHDPETGFNYNFHRHYDPAIAGYSSSDPIGMEGGYAPQKYVDNPISWYDPLGLNPCYDRFIQSANELHKGGEYTVAGRALQKKLGRPGEAYLFEEYRPSKGDPAGYNEAANRFVEDVMANPSTVVQEEYGRVAGKYEELISFRLDGGQGVGLRFTKAGEFVGFVA
ncbi:RHS repeat-associated core domain-containing protein [Saccharopolyspora sp. WRP15-2]|uniref:RHS repeat-associated core domain-containing protein n=1 Tax=Saccharopolyspora oryzae TaxID=2997343 RepID=A0ABT4V0H5_9PSEU|nr:RHS repeat-associated core domain-containing protein [Saccharopolyspora oryzae]MDA3626904.1 RHS repeat-associated core domain-containing protein [Saccharopolyspora oryzae]